ncbi:MAG: hypothetical protein Q9217_005318 [Psora testacea]
MPAADAPAIIVARFLKANQYDETFDAFIKEAGLPPDAGTTEKGDLTIEKILEEKKVFDVNLLFERSAVNDKNSGWALPEAPSIPTIVSLRPSSSNLLHVSVETIGEASDDHGHQLLYATTVDRRITEFYLERGIQFAGSFSDIQDSPILSCAPMSRNCLKIVTSAMSGQVVVFARDGERILEKRRDHKKYIVKVATWLGEETVWSATAGWDGKVFLYKTTSEKEAILGSPVSSITLPTNPETVLFVKHPNSDHPILLVTRRDSTSLHYYALPSANSSALSPAGGELHLLGTQNLAPHSNAWIAFSPLSVVVCPTDPSLLAVATSAAPHMKLIIVRILWPSLPNPDRPSAEPETQAVQMRNNLAVQDREDGAIQVHVSTLAPQTPYSTPQVVWRPDGSGVWVNGDDGVIRGLEAKTGKIVATLKDGHKAGSRIRSIWCGHVHVESGKREEWVVSGGFDQRLIVWRPKEAESS